MKKGRDVPQDLREFLNILEEKGSLAHVEGADCTWRQVFLVVAFGFFSYNPVGVRIVKAHVNFPAKDKNLKKCMERIRKEPSEE